MQGSIPYSEFLVSIHFCFFKNSSWELSTWTWQLWVQVLESDIAPQYKFCNEVMWPWSAQSQQRMSSRHLIIRNISHRFSFCLLHPPAQCSTFMKPRKNRCKEDHREGKIYFCAHSFLILFQILTRFNCETRFLTQNRTQICKNHNFLAIT